MALPPAQTDGAVALERSLQQRRSLRRFGAGALTRAEVAQLAWAAQGVTGSGAAAGRRSAPSAGALYPLTLWLVAGRVDGLAAGVYRYDPDTHALLPVRLGDARGAVAGAAAGQRWVADAPAVFVLAADPARTAARYGARAERFVALEAGAAAQSLALQAVALGLGSTLVGSLDAAALQTATGLPSAQQPLAILPVGRLP